MPANPSTIPGSATFTNSLAEPLKVEGLKLFAPGEVRLVTLSTFLLPQRAAVWNALWVAKTNGLLTTGTSMFEVDALPTGHQATQGNGGQG